MSCRLCLPVAVAVLAAVICRPATAADSPPTPATSPADVYGEVKVLPKDGFARMPAEWFCSEQARRFAVNVLVWQTPSGGWPKVGDLHVRVKTGPPGGRGSFDNGATVPPMRFVGHMANATGEQRYVQSFMRALEFVLSAQLPCGGWPQWAPRPKGYAALITYNDNAMINVMTILREVAAGEFAFVPPADVARADAAVQRGIQCILRTQIVVDGRLTAWGQQHDPHTFAPAKARAFELPSICAAESTGIVLFLMDIENPSDEVKRAVHSAVAWFKASKIEGIRWVRADGDRVVVADPQAPPIWARFYDIRTNRPMFVGRDSVPRAHVADIERERRTGYRWYGHWPAAAIARYDDWCAAHAATPAD